LKKIGRKDWNRHKNILIGQINNKIKSFRMIKHKYNLENIYTFRLFTKILKRSTQIIYNYDIREKLDEYFGTQ